MVTKKNITFFFFIFFHIHNSSSGYIKAKKKYHDYEETFNKCRQLQKVLTQTGSRGSTPRANKEEGQRAVKMAPQSANGGGVAGGGNSFFPSFELSA